MFMKLTPRRCSAFKLWQESCGKSCHGESSVVRRQTPASVLTMWRLTFFGSYSEQSLLMETFHNWRQTVRPARLDALNGFRRLDTRVEVTLQKCAIRGSGPFIFHRRQAECQVPRAHRSEAPAACWSSSGNVKNVDILACHGGIGKLLNLWPWRRCSVPLHTSLRQA